MPPAPIMQSEVMNDLVRYNVTKYIRCPIQACGEWTEIPIIEVDESMRM